jgi:hypothetical protein
MFSISFFNTVDQAMEYRHTNGTGGWIFAPESPVDGSKHWTECAKVLLFPPDFTPSLIFTHPLTRGQSGKLISQ